MSTSSSSKSAVDAVIFDMGGVLIPSPGKFFKDYEAIYNLPMGSLVRTIVASGDNGSWAQLERGEIDLETFTKSFENDYFIQNKLKVEKQSFLPEFMKYFSRGEPNESMINAIKCLKINGLKTALLTNNCLLPDKKTFMPLDPSLFDVVVESAKVGMRKPEERIYKHVLSLLNVPPQKAVFLDDLGHNLKTAQSLGLFVIKVENQEKALEELEGIVGFSLRTGPKDTVEIPTRLSIDVTKLEQYINEKLNIIGTSKPELKLFKYGQSNPTYHVSYAGHTFVLRKKPPGALLASAHAVDREYHVMKTLKEHSSFPVPQVLCFCEDENIIGTPFYMMKYLDGVIFQDPLLPGLSPDMKRKVILGMASTLASLHRLDVSALNMQDFGAKGSYMARNLKRWWKQYELSITTSPLPSSSSSQSSSSSPASPTNNVQMDSDALPNMPKIFQWLESRLPTTDEQVSLIHGDYKLDNLIFDPVTYDILGIIDWELSTIGDPLTDLANSCMLYMASRDNGIVQGLEQFSDEQLKELGIPTMDEYVDHYFSSVGSHRPSNWDFYLVFTLYRVAAILQGVHKRNLMKQSSSSTAHLAHALAKVVDERGYNICLQSKLAPSTPPSSRLPSLPNKKEKINHSTTADAIKKLPPMPTTVSSLRTEVQQMHAKIRAFVHERIIPLEDSLFEWHSNPESKWTVHPKIESLKSQAKEQGLWNLFITKELDEESKCGKGLTNVEYSFIAEETGWSMFAPEVFNCSAPDTGNMEVLMRYASDEQKQKWLMPLLDGSIRSCFGMTEPDVASSDATNIEASVERRGDGYVINGRKWWTSGAMDPRCKIIIFMGKTNKNEQIHKQQSMLLVPLDSKGVKVVRHLNVFGFDDAPHGHAEVTFEDVYVPAENVILGEGRGFEIAQGRLGPGRVHHCMRILGATERCLQMLVDRAQKRVAFGKPLIEQGTIQRDIAEARINLEQGRLLVLKAAHMMDCIGNKSAALEIAMIKSLIPRMACQIIDRAIQVHGAKGVCQDVVLTHMYAFARSMCIADGPDEVHLRTIAKMEIKKNNSKL